MLAVVLNDCEAMFVSVTTDWEPMVRFVYHFYQFKYKRLM